MTKVSEREGLSQPAVSRILGKLRFQLGDNLLVKSGSAMVLTDRGELLKSPVQEILANVDSLNSDFSFDPYKSNRTFIIGCADCLAPSFIPSVIQRILTLGPNIKLKFKAIDQSFDAASALETGSLDIIINNHPKPREDLRTSPLYSDEVVCLMRENHQFSEYKRLSLARYLSAKHVAPNPSADGEAGPIMGSMLRSGYRRDIVVTIPEYNLIPHVLQGSDLIFTTGRRFAEAQMRLSPLSIVPAPLEFAELKFYQLWHQRKHGSLSSRWLREQLREVAQEMK